MRKIVGTLFFVFFLIGTMGAYALAKDEVQMNVSMSKEVTDVLPLMKGSLLGMQIASCVTQFAARLTMSYIVFYVVTPGPGGLSYTEWGSITTIMGIIGLFTSMPGGLVADKYDKRKLVSFARSIEPVTTVGYIFLRGFWSLLGIRAIAGVGMGLSGAGAMGVMGGAAWSALMADLVPPEKRGRINGLMATISGVTTLPAPYIGAYMWESPSIGPENSLWVTAISGLASAVILWVTVRDPRWEQRQANKTSKVEVEKHDSSRNIQGE